MKTKEKWFLLEPSQRVVRYLGFKSENLTRWTKSKIIVKNVKKKI